MPDDAYDQFEPGVEVNDQTAEGASSLEDILGDAYDNASQDSDGDGSGDGSDGAGGGQRGADASGQDRGGDQSSNDDDAADDHGGHDQGALEAPTHWASADREMFARQTPEAQRWLMERSRAMEAAHTQRSQEIAPLRNAVQKWGPYLQQLGATPDQAFDRLINAEYTLRTGTQEQKRDALRQFVRDYGITKPGQNEPQIAPEVAQVQHQVNQLNAMQQQQINAARQANVANATAQVTAFRDEKMEDGNLAHPFFADVEADMTMLAQADLAAGRQPEISDLYERACWSNPTVRQRLIEANSELEAEQRKANAQRKRNAGSTISGAGAAQSAQPQSLEDQLSAEWDRLSA